MRVFLSWSGDASRQVAELLRTWLPNVLQVVRPWMSSEDLAKGGRWSEELATQLRESAVGIICVTPENSQAPWILFEAGAVANAIGARYVCPYLVGLGPTDLRGPLAQFQAAVANKKDTRGMVRTINTALSKDGLSADQIDRSFEKWWPELESGLVSVVIRQPEKVPGRTDRELLEEIVLLLRDLSRHTASPAQQSGSVTTLDPDREEKARLVLMNSVKSWLGEQDLNTEGELSDSGFPRL